MRVLFLTRYPIEGASSRYRVFQYLPFLDAAGIGYEIQSFMTPGMYRSLSAPSSTVRKIAHASGATIRRLSAIRKAPTFDLVFMQRECFPAGPPLAEKWFRKSGVPTIFDYDDALFIFRESTHTPLADRFKRPSRVLDIFRNVDCVLAGNDWLRAQAEPYCRDVRVFHVAEDLVRFRPRPENAGDGSAITIGWLGSPSTERYLGFIREPLRTICARHPRVRVKVVGGAGRFSDPSIPVEHVPWSLQSEVEQLHSFDIGIMPLPLEEWSLGKSGGKARTYMAVGLPVVCTDIGFNRELVRHGETGFLATDEGEWEQALQTLISDAALRRTMGAAARLEVERRFALSHLGPRFVEILRDVARR